MNPDPVSLNILRYGREESLPERVPLRAGPVSLIYQEGDLRYLRLGGSEILRRIYGAVRDHNWGTVPMSLIEIERDIREDSFRIVYDARHRDGPIEFAWRGILQGDPDGTICYCFEGEALTTFLKNRIGICVLHPVRECSGQPCIVEHTDSSKEESRLPGRISPHQPFCDIAAISHEVLPGVRAEVRFSGEIFEMEDQRNWTDASYKTYSTPLALPYPAEIPAGTCIDQSVTLSLHGEIPELPESTSGGIVTVSDLPAGKFPAIGLCAAPQMDSLTETEVSRLRSLKLAHLRADLPLSAPDWRETLRQAGIQSEVLDVPLYIALHLSPDSAADQLQEFRQASGDLEQRIAGWVIFPTTEEMAALVRRVVSTGIPVGSGSSMDFTELNRDRPPAGRFDFLCYPVNPQVHAFDNTSIMETLETQGETLRTAHTFTFGTPIAVGPVALSRKGADGRHRSLFGAAWTLGSLKYLAENEAASITYYQTKGTQGILEADEVFPLYHILAAAADFRGGEVIQTEVSDPLIAAVLMLKKNDRMRLLAANLTPDSQQITLRRLPFETGRIRTLDETAVLEAMGNPEAFHTAPAPETAIPKGEITLNLLPYAVAFLDNASSF